MKNDTGENASKTLNGGEIIYLVKEPGAKWRIRSYECHQGIVAGSLLFAWMQGLPEDWKDRKFENPDEAIEFAQQEIKSGRIPANRQEG
jgi:hypothetical protein